jgi:hypothetical protein
LTNLNQTKAPKETLKFSITLYHGNNLNATRCNKENLDQVSLIFKISKGPFGSLELNQISGITFVEIELDGIESIRI